MLDVYLGINVWNAKESRKYIEAGTALPQAKGCYPARDIVAHPAIVTALARVPIDLGLRRKMIAEMNEATAPMEKILEDIGL